MRAFACPGCRALLFFENSACLACGLSVAFDRDTRGFVPADTHPRCTNAELSGCNWTAPAGGRCACCALTRTRPEDEDSPGLTAFARALAAARRLFYQLDDLGLPVPDRNTDPERGLAFDLKSSAEGPVITGHADGVITLDLAESDDGYREAMRVQLAEPYRTLLGHFRHEVGHFYWMLLVEERAALSVFRDLFGDERADYGEALEAHYSSEPRADWADTYVSVYATAHPWEDWAETFAHYLHIHDCVQTASAFGVVVTGPDLDTEPDPEAPLTSLPREHHEDFDELIDTWLPLTYALNAVNRSMGRDDLYPFLLSPTVLEKLRLVHSLISEEGQPHAPADDAAGDLIGQS